MREPTGGVLLKNLVDPFKYSPQELLDRVGVPLFDGHLFFDLALLVEQLQDRIGAAQIANRQCREQICLPAFDESLQLRPPRQFSSAELEASSGVLLSRHISAGVVLTTF